jgi:hypothetical protein
MWRRIVPYKLADARLFAAYFLLDAFLSLLFYHEDGGSKFLWNISEL